MVSDSRITYEEIAATPLGQALSATDGRIEVEGKLVEIVEAVPVGASNGQAPPWTRAHVHGAPATGREE